MNKEKNCRNTDFLHYKQSDKRELSADAKILIALIHGQPLKRINIIKKAGIDPSSFSRNKRLLLNKMGIKETSKGYCLYNFIEQSTFWDRVRLKCLNAGGPLVDLKLHKLVLGEQDSITGWFETNYDNVVSIQGIMIHRGAIELKTTASTIIPISGDYSAILLTQDSLDDGDHLECGADLYEAKDVEAILDGNEFSFRIAKLIFIPK